MAYCSQQHGNQIQVVADIARGFNTKRHKRLQFSKFVKILESLTPNQVSLFRKLTQIENRRSSYLRPGVLQRDIKQT